MSMLDSLHPAMKERLERALASCSKKGYDIRPFWGRRTPQEQALLWKQSRTDQEAEVLACKMEDEKAPFLAHILREAKPVKGRWATNKLPGQSWHQWGEAVDFMVVGGNGQAVWAASHPGYLAMASAARDAGMVAGFFWERKDIIHVQLRADSVRSLFTWSQINKEMEKLSPSLV